MLLHSSYFSIYDMLSMAMRLAQYGRQPLLESDRRPDLNVLPHVGGITTRPPPSKSSSPFSTPSLGTKPHGKALDRQHSLSTGSTWSATSSMSSPISRSSPPALHKSLGVWIGTECTVACSGPILAEPRQRSEPRIDLPIVGVRHSSHSSKHLNYN